MADSRAYTACSIDAEALLVQQARERSNAAWTQIYEENYDKLYRYVYGRVGDQAHAQDLAASVFVEALRGIDSFSYRGKPILAWLYRIARNLVSDYLRSRERELRVLDRHSGRMEEFTFADRSDERRDLIAALQTLTADQREAIVLRYFADLPTSEVARLMNKSEQAVFSLHARGLAALQRTFKGDAGRPTNLGSEDR